MLEDFDTGSLVQPLLDWFLTHARPLPWREHVTPYRVWVSEIMLQQTRVEAVIPYYERFVTVLPDVQSLASCPEDTLYKLWEGLGYYSRVRNMQKAARIILTDFHGCLPGDAMQLQMLPGIGSYTAGAISSIAFGRPVPAVDGNVLRILMRVSADESDIAKASVKKRTEACLRSLMADTFYDAAAEAIPQSPPGSGKDARADAMRGPGAFNQALMDLGATLCRPNGAALCEQCPWQRLCLAHARNLTDILPVKSGAKERRIEERTVLLIERTDEILIRRRPDSGLLAGLYELPNFTGKLSADEAVRLVSGMGLTPLHIEALPDAKHIFSHIEWHMCGYRIRLDALNPRDVPYMLFVPVSETKDRYAIPSAFAAYKRFLHD